MFSLSLLYLSLLPFVCESLWAYCIIPLIAYSTAYSPKNDGLVSSFLRGESENTVIQYPATCSPSFMSILEIFPAMCFLSPNRIIEYFVLPLSCHS